MEIKVLTIKEDILGVNEEKARKNQDRLNENGITAINIMPSPGAGKTSLIGQTISRLKSESRLAVIEGDAASQIDADKLHQHGVPIIQINIPGGCHLDANMIENALDNLPLKELDLILIENVGNLVYPAEFNLGEHKKVVLSSMPEGDDCCWSTIWSVGNWSGKMSVYERTDIDHERTNQVVHYEWGTGTAVECWGGGTTPRGE